jgi:hypothetical protein
MMREMKHDALAMTEYSDAPAVLVVADSEAGLARGRQATELAGLRVSDAIGIEGAAQRLDRQVATKAVLAEIENDHGADLERFLERIDAAAAAGRHGSVVCTPLALVDRIFARAPHSSVIQLCDPSESERVTAICVASMPASARLHDIGKGTARLQQLSEEVGRIANILATLSEDEAPAESPIGDEAESALSASALRAMIRARRLREQYFHAEWFADPAWDMLLDLMAARLDRQRVAVSSLCIAAAVPATTALRWIKTLTDSGLFVRTADPQDGRRVFIELSDKAAAQLGAYLRAVQRISPLVI